MSSSRDCSPKQGSFIDLTSPNRKKHNVGKIVANQSALGGSVGGGSGNAINTYFAEESSFDSISDNPTLATNTSGSPTTLSIFSNITASRNPNTMPPIGSGPSRQRSLRDRLKEGITGSFTWQ